MQAWRPLLCAVGLSVALIACGSSATTNVTGPTAVTCQVTLSNSSGSFGFNGGSGTVTVTTSRECAWSASASGAWIHITGERSGQGEGHVSYSVDANGVAASRQANVVVNGQSAAVSQAAAPCKFDVSAPGSSLDAAGGQVAIGVRTTDSCRWTAAADASWATISPTSGQGATTLAVVAAPNSGPERTVTLTIGSDHVVLRQLSAPGSPPAPNPPSPSPSPSPAPAPTPPPQPPGPAPSPIPPPNPPPAPNPVVDLKGQVSELSGRCPTLAFFLDTTKVQTTSDTAFQRGPCKDLKNRDKITVRGSQQPDGTVIASVVSLRED